MGEEKPPFAVDAIPINYKSRHGIRPQFIARELNKLKMDKKLPHQMEKDSLVKKGGLGLVKKPIQERF